MYGSIGRVDHAQMITGSHQQVFHTIGRDQLHITEMIDGSVADLCLPQQFTVLCVCLYHSGRITQICRTVRCRKRFVFFTVVSDDQHTVIDKQKILYMGERIRNVPEMTALKVKDTKCVYTILLPEHDCDLSTIFRPAEIPDIPLGILRQREAGSRGKIFRAHDLYGVGVTAGNVLCVRRLLQEVIQLILHRHFRK